MAEGVDSIFDRLWSDCIEINPRLQQIHRLLVDGGGQVVHDHVALRTFRHPKLGIDRTARLFERLGYRAAGAYECPVRRLNVRHYERDDPGLPKVIVSELGLEECSRGLRDMVESMMRQVQPEELPQEAFVLGGCLWHRVLKDTWESLYRESEYAAWIAAFGMRAHHFSVLVNALEPVGSLRDLDALFGEHGFALDREGGAIKGSPGEGLEWSAVPAEACRVQFADGVGEIPGCPYEFVYRHPLPGGEAFPGFPPQPADPVVEGMDDPAPA